MNRDVLIREIDAFCAQHDITPTQFGRMALRNPAFVGRLKGQYAGRPILDPRGSTLDRIYNFMDHYDELEKRHARRKAAP